MTKPTSSRRSLRRRTTILAALADSRPLNIGEIHIRTGIRWRPLRKVLTALLSDGELRLLPADPLGHPGAVVYGLPFNSSARQCGDAGD